MRTVVPASAQELMLALGFRPVSATTALGQRDGYQVGLRFIASARHGLTLVFEVRHIADENVEELAADREYGSPLEAMRVSGRASFIHTQTTSWLTVYDVDNSFTPESTCALLDGFLSKLIESGITADTRCECGAAAPAVRHSAERRGCTECARQTLAMRAGAELQRFTAAVRWVVSQVTWPRPFSLRLQDEITGG